MVKILRPMAFHFFLLAALAVLLCQASLRCAAAQRPALHEIDAINDSIVDEGHMLYLYEKLAWVTTDAYDRMCSSKTASFYVSGALNDSLLSCIMIDVDRLESVFECRLNTLTGEIEPFNMVRSLTRAEVARAERQVTLLEKLGEESGVKNVASVGRLNPEIVEIKPGLTRLYLLQGTTLSKLIPFGNDYSFDFDDDNNVIARRQYHKSFLPVDFSSADGIKKCTHSHLSDNPYVTPTDVATFLLYGHDLYQMKTFSVYSTALSCYFTYDADTSSIILVDDSQDMQSPE